MDFASPTQASRGVTLDSPPPRPNGFSTIQPKEDSGLGELANSPQLLTMQGMAMIKDGMELLGRGLPMLSPMLQDAVTTLEQLVAQGMTGAMAGQAAAPPGVAPMMQPPPGGPAGPMPGGPAGGPTGAPPGM